MVIDKYLKIFVAMEMAPSWILVRFDMNIDAQMQTCTPTIRAIYSNVQFANVFDSSICSLRD